MVTPALQSSADREAEPQPPAGRSLLPPGFELLYFPNFPDFPPEGAAKHLVADRIRLTGRGPTVVARRSAKAKLLELAAHAPAPLAAGPLVTGWLEGGRTRHAIVDAGEESWVLKAYRRGGAVGRWNTDRYWGTRRFLNELGVAALAERVGVPTAEILALVLEPAGLGSFRAWLVTRFLAGTRPLFEYFGQPGQAALFRRAGELVARMHRASIDHPDLHLGNLVGSLRPVGVGEGADGSGVIPQVHIVDWDRARHRPSSSWNPYANLARLWRSIEKARKLRRKSVTGPSLSDVTPTAFRAFVHGYFAGRPHALREARAYFRRRAVLLGIRARFWRPRSAGGA